jgi:zinc protease
MVNFNTVLKSRQTLKKLRPLKKRQILMAEGRLGSLVAIKGFFRDFKLLFLILLSFVGLTIPVTAKSPTNQPEKLILPNGLTLLSCPEPEARLTTISVWVKAGPLTETPENSGISHFVEHLIFRGTPYKGAAEIAASVEALGGDLNGFTSSDFTCFHLTVPSQYFHQAADILLDLMAHPVLSKTNIENEKKVVLEEIFHQEENPLYFLDKTVDQNFFDRHPYGRPISGTIESVTSLTPEKIINYYRSYYQPANLVIVVCGQFNKEELLNQTKKYFPENSAGKIPRLTQPGRSIHQEEKNFTVFRPVSQVYLSLALPAPPVGSRDSAVMDVILKILSGGQSGRLNQKIKEKKNLVTEINASYTTRKDPGNLSINAILTDPPKTADTISAIKEELHQLSTQPVADEELAKAKDQTATEYYLNQETAYEKAYLLGYFEAIDSYLYGLRYLEEIDRINSADILNVARKYLATPAVIGLIKPESFQSPPSGNTA